MPEPLLDIGDVGLVLEGVGRGRCSQCVQAQPVDFDPGTGRVSLEHLVDPVAGEVLLELPGAVVADRPEEGSGSILAVSGETQVLLDG